jgi:hypothetical protein
LQLALDQIVFARGYTENLLGHIDEKDWFRMPAGGVTHVAWQVGHLAMAEYRLGMARLRGKRAEDADLISDAFIGLFGRDSAPDPDSNRYPSVGEMRSVFDKVHAQLLRELASLPEEELDKPLLAPHPLAKTKLEAMLWCGQHEMLHAGQIGLLRRELGAAPLW